MNMSEKNRYEVGFSSDALRQPRRIVFITRKTSAKVKEEVGPQLMSFPHVILRESIAFQFLTIVLVGLALFWDAPLEQLANPLLTPNPAKAPWYFLGLQELVSYSAFWGGVVVPGLLVTLFLSYTGYLLPWDQLAFWAITVGTNIISYVPVLGRPIRFLLLGGHIIGQNALLRFYVLHCVILPLAAVGLIGMHFWRLQKDGGLTVRDDHE